MKIDLREHLEFVHGVAEVAPGARGLRLNRMTPAALKTCEIAETRMLRGRCCSGVRIRFDSDTRAVTLKLGLGIGEARPVYTTDVVVDGETTLTFGADSAGQDYDVQVAAPGPGKHRYEIHLPHLCESEVLGLEVDDGASLAPAAYPGEAIIFIGDSITQGMTTTSPARAYATRLAAALDRDFTNLSVGGAQMDEALGAAALAYQWGSAYVAYGINDWSSKRPLEEFARQTRGMLRNLSSRPGAKIRIITPLPFVRPITDPHPNTVDDFRQCIRDVAAEFPGVQIIEGPSLMPAEERLFIDGLHPNDDGMQAMAESLLALH